CSGQDSPRLRSQGERAEISAPLQHLERGGSGQGYAASDHDEEHDNVYGDERNGCRRWGGGTLSSLGRRRISSIHAADTIGPDILLDLPAFRTTIACFPC